MLVVVLILGLPVGLLAGPKVEIVVAEKAPALEKLAADEVAATLKRLYQAHVTQVAVPSGSLPIIFIGSHASNPALEFAQADWPDLSEHGHQGHLLKSTRHRDQPALILGGGSSVATYWAVQEFLHRLGVRSFLYGDLDPVSPPEFSLAGYDSILKPEFRDRAWQLGGDSPLSSISWGRDELQRFVHQLAKLKFSRVWIAVRPGQPYVHLEVDGIKKQSAQLWDSEQFPVSGDTAGRSAFGGAKFFENPEFAGKVTYEERLSAGQAQLQAVIDTAHELGMTAGLIIDPLALPSEFTKQAQKSTEAFDSVAEAQLAAYERMYPKLDAICLRSGSDDAFARQFIQSKARSSHGSSSYRMADRANRFQRTNNKIRPPEAGIILDLGSSLRKTGELSAELEVNYPAPKSLMLHLTSEAGLLPQSAYSPLVKLTAKMKSHFYQGYVAQHDVVADLDFPAYMLSRLSFGDKLAPAQACDQMLKPVCGEEVHARVFKALELAERATTLIDLNDPNFAHPVPQMVLKHYASTDPAPVWWGEVRESYLNAMNEMYRANTRAREGSRSYTLYLARRYEFGFEYMNCMQAMRNAGVAKKAGDKEKQISELEKAIDSINSACNALAAVARSNSDRGTIAVLNAHIYRPLVKELEMVESEE